MTAAEKILGKALVGSSLDTKGWSAIQAGLRDRAFFSSQVEDARILHEARRMCADVADGRLSASEFRRDMRALLAKMGHPEGDGGLKDLYSEKRLDVLLDTNVRQARGYVQHLEATTRGALMAFPAQELVRVQEREQPRDWKERWARAGGRFYGGRMIALKTDPIWANISAFGTPWPPFDFNSGMGVEDIDFDEAVELGVITEDADIQEPEAPAFNEGLEVELPAKGLAEMDVYMREAFGDQISIVGNKAHWNPRLIRDLFEGKTTQNARLGQGLLDTDLLAKAGGDALVARGRKAGLTVTAQWMQTHGRKHETPSGDAGTNMPLTEGDFELIPAMWRRPDAVAVHSKNEISLSLDTLDGGTLLLGVNLSDGSPTTFRKERTAKAPSSAKTAHAGRRTFAVTEDSQAQGAEKGKAE